MTGYFVTDDERGQQLWHGSVDDPDPEWLAIRSDAGSGVTDPAVFDAAAAVLAPDDALVERVAQAKHRAKYPDGSHDACPASSTELAQVRAVLAAVREEAGR